MGQTGDTSAQQSQPPAAPEGHEQPMIKQDVTPAATDAHTIADEAAPEDVTTLVVPQASLTPPPATPPKPGGSPQPQPAASPPQPPSPYVDEASRWQGEHRVHQVPPAPQVPHIVPVVDGQRPPRPAPPSHAPWHTSSSWGATTFVITAETAAGFSYLFWWISGLVVYFNERENRYVRFHAVQSILLTGALSVFSVVAFTIAALFNDFYQSSHMGFWHTLSMGTFVLSLFVVVFPWLAVMLAAWTGAYLQLPIIGDYAERFAAPPIQLRP